MKKMKKFFAVILSLAMVLGMSITAFATEAGTATQAAGKITVEGLTKEDTTVKIYKVVSWNEAQSKWEAEAWAKDHVDLTKDPVDIDWDALKDVATDANLYQAAKTVSNGTAEFDNLGIGAYLITANGATTVYNVMGDFTYAYDSDNLMVPAQKKISAKASDYQVVKTFKNGDPDKFVKLGDSIPFVITTTFPSYEDGTGNRTFTITDTPTGMKITDIKVKVGNDDLHAGTEYTLDKTLPSTEAVTVNFATDYIGTENTHAGKTVTVEVTATVTEAGKYSNEATTNKASDPSKVEGETGSITINKVDKGNNVLKGAEFSVALDGTKLEFVEVETGVYRLATADDAADTKVTNVVATNGTVVVKGLDEGTYKIVEEKAPKGYSVVDVADQTISAGQNANITVKVTDTKLSALPHTGGIGTTIFTIAGCAIMVAAAFFFFASRKKANK